MMHDIRPGVVLALVMLTLSGCSAPEAALESAPLPPPAALRAPPPTFEPSEVELGTQVAWEERGKSVSVTVWGSSSCHHVPITTRVIESTEIVIDFELTGGDACTADLRSYSYIVEIPPGARGIPLTVSLTLPGWNDEDTVKGIVLE